MNLKFYQMYKIVFSLFLVVLTLLFTNCHKVAPTKTIITAVNESKVPLANVKITIRAQSTQGTPANGNLSDSGVTDAKGEVAFDFSSIYKDGQAGVAVLDVKGEIVIEGVEYEGFSYVQLEAGITKSATVIIRKKVVEL
jgi:hypothetical protein